MPVSDEDECSVRDLAHMLGKKWTIPIVEEIYFSNNAGVHFNGFLASIDGINPGILAKELDELTAEGILQKSTASLNRTRYVNYTLTKKGLLLANLIDKAKEFCTTCCPLGASCKYAYIRRRAPTKSVSTTLLSSR